MHIVFPFFLQTGHRLECRVPSFAQFDLAYEQKETFRDIRVRLRLGIVHVSRRAPVDKFRRAIVYHLHKLLLIGVHGDDGIRVLGRHVTHVIRPQTLKPACGHIFQQRPEVCDKVNRRFEVVFRRVGVIHYVRVVQDSHDIRNKLCADQSRRHICGEVQKTLRMEADDHVGPGEQYVKEKMRRNPHALSATDDGETFVGGAVPVCGDAPHRVRIEAHTPIPLLESLPEDKFGVVIETRLRTIGSDYRDFPFTRGVHRILFMQAVSYRHDTGRF